jgi:adenylosuccinate synthase
LHAYIVVDLGFGDSGKGLLTDFLVRHLNAGVIVRYNGGAQAGHNVVTPDGRHHTFSQFGSGTFVPHVKTYLSRYVVIHPEALLVEGAILEGKGLRDVYSRLRVSEEALVITPFHQAANHIREIVRGANRHGSCGVGVGEAVEDALLNDESCVLAGDLTDPALLRRKLHSIREQKREQITALCKNIPLGSLLDRECKIFDEDGVIEAWISSVARIGKLGLVIPDSELARCLRETKNVVFEGAQGVLLDADAGFHPYTTWSCCTAVNALDLIKEMVPDSHIFQFGVMRSYAVRHGPGPLPTETDVFTSAISEHNKHNEWQGTVRYGWFDAVLARYALGMTGGVDSIVVTHLDVLPHLKTWQHCVGYKGSPDFDAAFVDSDISDGVLTSFRLPRFLPLAQRAQFTQYLSAVAPILETCETDDRKVIEKIETLIGQPVGIISRGPSADNVEILHSIPSGFL